MIPYSIDMIKSDLGSGSKSSVTQWSNVLVAVGSAFPTAMFITWCKISNEHNTTGENNRREGQDSFLCAF